MFNGMNGKSTEFRQNKSDHLCSGGVADIVCCVFCGVAVFAATGIMRIYFVYLLVMSILSSYNDVYMSVYILRRLDGNDIIFGPYKKSNK